MTNTHLNPAQLHTNPAFSQGVLAGKISLHIVAADAGAG